MGILDELVILVKETIEEAKQRQQQQESSSSSQRSPEEIEALKRTLARRAMQQREADSQAAAQSAHSAHQAEAARHHAELERQRQQRIQKSANPASVKHATTHRAAKLLRQPQTLRELIILKELLDRPISQRGGIRR